MRSNNKMNTEEYKEKHGTYWEAELKVKVRPESNKCFQNVHTESFDHEPSIKEAMDATEKNHPHLEAVDVVWVRDMSHKAAELTNYYNTKQFTGD